MAYGHSWISAPKSARSAVQVRGALLAHKIRVHEFCGFFSLFWVFFTFLGFFHFFGFLVSVEDAGFLEIGCDPYTTQQISRIGWLYLHRHLG